MELKKLTFKVRNEKKELVDPRWREIEVVNADCPLCQGQLIVVMGYQKPIHILYGYCPRCNKYFLGE